MATHKYYTNLEPEGDLSVTIDDTLSGVTTSAVTAELNTLAGVTPGAAAASKAVVLDSSNKIDTLDITTPKIGGTAVTATAAELNELHSVTPGTATASKAVVLDSSKQVDVLDVKAPGENASKVTTITSSSILTATPSLLFTASGEVLVENVLFNTDGTGLAGGTNLQLKKNTTTKCAETVANLGASAEVLGTAASVTPFAPLVLDNGDTLNLQSTVGNCTGTGVLTITVVARKLTTGAAIS